MKPALLSRPIFLGFALAAVVVLAAVWALNQPPVAEGAGGQSRVETVPASAAGTGRRTQSSEDVLTRVDPITLGLAPAAPTMTGQTTNGPRSPTAGLAVTALSIEDLRTRGHRGDVEAMLELARRLVDADPSEASLKEALFWCDEGTVLGSTEAARLAGDLCLTNCNPPNADDPRDFENWSMAAQYYFLAYLMGDELALERLRTVTPGGVDPSQVYMALGLARMRLEEVIAAREQRGLGPFKMDLNATSPYLKPDPPKNGGEYLLPSPGGG